MKTLNNKQRKFLEYIQKHHSCLGWEFRVENILEKNEYKIESGISEVMVILDDWAIMLNNSHGRLCTIYGIPKKYLSIPIYS